jgi:hypothetical protein
MCDEGHRIGKMLDGFQRDDRLEAGRVLESRSVAANELNSLMTVAVARIRDCRFANIYTYDQRSVRAGSEEVCAIAHAARNVEDASSGYVSGGEPITSEMELQSLACLLVVASTHGVGDQALEAVRIKWHLRRLPLRFVVRQSCQNPAGYGIDGRPDVRSDDRAGRRPEAIHSASASRPVERAHIPMHRHG